MRRLASRSFTSARTGIRRCFVTVSLSVSLNSLLRCLAPWQSRDRDPWWLAGQHCSSTSEDAFLPLSPTGTVALTVTKLRTLFNQDVLRPVETFCIASLGQRVDSRHRILGSRKVLNFKALRLSVLNLSCPEDSLKLRSNPGSRKIADAEFSTFGKIACGGRWTTQRFGAFATCRNQLLPNVPNQRFPK